MFEDSRVRSNRARLRRIHRDIYTEKQNKIINPLEKQLERYKKSMEAKNNVKTDIKQARID